MVRISKKHRIRIVLTGLVVILAFIFLLPQHEVYAQAQPNTVSRGENEQTSIILQADVINLHDPNLSNAKLRLPDNEIKVKKTVTVTITAYNAVPEQTDNNPCLTADGTNVCQNKDIKVVAANWLPLGTKIRIPDYFGDTIFEVHDRMNPRYNDRLDVLMESVAEAKQFGVRQLKVEIL